MEKKKSLTQRLKDMRIGTTMIVYFDDPGQLTSLAVICNRLKKEKYGEWSVRKDYEEIAASVTRNK